MERTGAENQPAMKKRSTPAGKGEKGGIPNDWCAIGGKTWQKRAVRDKF